MRRNNTRSETKEHPPRLLAGKRKVEFKEKPETYKDAFWNTIEDCHSSVLAQAFGCVLLLITWAVIVLFRPTDPAYGQTQPLSPLVSIPTAADYSVAFKSLRDRFDQLKTEVHHESLDSLGIELDQLEKEMAFVARVEADLQQTFGQVRQKLREREIARV